MPRLPLLFVVPGGPMTVEQISDQALGSAVIADAALGSALGSDAALGSAPTRDGGPDVRALTIPFTLSDLALLGGGPAAPAVFTADTALGSAIVSDALA